MKTLSKLVLPQAPSPMMTSFLDGRSCQRKETRRELVVYGSLPKWAANAHLRMTSGGAAIVEHVSQVLRSSPLRSVPAQLEGAVVHSRGTLVSGLSGAREGRGSGRKGSRNSGWDGSDPFECRYGALQVAVPEKF